MKWDLQECHTCGASRKTLYAFKDDRDTRMCKKCYNKKLKEHGGK